MATQAYLTAKLGHLKGVQCFRVTHIHSNGFVLVLCICLLILDLYGREEIKSTPENKFNEVLHLNIEHLILTSLARSREALAALSVSVSRPISHALDLFFSQFSLYLICERAERTCLTMQSTLVNYIYIWMTNNVPRLWNV